MRGAPGAGIGTITPAQGHKPRHRANALLKTTFAALRRVTACPQRIGHIVAAALVLLTPSHKTQ